MPGPRPSITEEKALRNLWSALAQYEAEVDDQISTAVNMKPGCIESMSYSQNDCKLKTNYQKLQATIEKGLVTSVGFANETQELSQEGDAPSGLTIKNITSENNADSVVLKLEFTGNTKPAEVTFGVNDAKGPKGNNGQDEQTPKNWSVDTDSDPGSASRYGAGGTTLAEAKTAFATGSMTGISASITVASVSASGFSFSFTGLDLGWDGVYYSAKVCGGNKTAIGKQTSTAECELSTMDVKVAANQDLLARIKDDTAALENQTNGFFNSLNSMRQE